MTKKDKNNEKQRWQVLKEITGKVQKNNQSSPTTLETENGIISNKNAIAEGFSIFFKNIGSNLANKLPQISKTFYQYLCPAYTHVDHQFETANY